MAFWLGTIAGAVAVMLVVLAYILFVAWAESRARRSQLLIARQRSAAERRMDRLMQDTIRDLMNAARRSG